LHLRKPLKEGVNTSLTPLNTLFSGYYESWIIERNLCVHDEILLEAPLEVTDEEALILKETMEEAGRSEAVAVHC
jgi:actin-like ATPase involved in cell morphogenesis